MIDQFYTSIPLPSQVVISSLIPLNGEIFDYNFALDHGRKMFQSSGSPKCSLDSASDLSYAPKIEVLQNGSIVNYVRISPLDGKIYVSP